MKLRYWFDCGVVILTVAIVVCGSNVLRNKVLAQSYDSAELTDLNSKIERLEEEWFEVGDQFPEREKWERRRQISEQIQQLKKERQRLEEQYRLQKKDHERYKEEAALKEEERQRRLEENRLQEEKKKRKAEDEKRRREAEQQEKDYNRRKAEMEEQQQAKVKKYNIVDQISGYDLVSNPFRWKNKVVVLRFSSFVKMLDSSTGVFRDVSTYEQFLVAKLPPKLFPIRLSSGLPPPDFLTYHLVVKVKGMTTAKNAFGASVELPLVEFVDTY
ncbi:MAG: hypothetical protein QME83_07390 [Thermodesulfobacteriota bacterium]|nr:hypothetical protein [Thermodesulfobacteriota bacterium]